MADIKVEGVSWNDAAVAEYASEKDFIDAHMSDAGTYALLTEKGAKEKALKLVYSIAVPKKAKADKGN